MRVRLGSWVALAGTVLLLGASASPAAQNYRLRGISPIFDGWETLPDGSRLFYFGYINREGVEVTVPAGPDNGFEPGPADRGQPTTFLPGRQEHVFTVAVPQDFSGKWAWTVRSAMGVQVANASLDQLYILEERENEDPNARPPVITVPEVSGRVGQAITLTPQVKAVATAGQVVVEGSAAQAAGLNVTWSGYRGPGAVVFSALSSAGPVADGGRGRGSAAPAGPAGSLTVSCGNRVAEGCGSVQARFETPGVYTLRAAARQDGMLGLAFVRVTVN
jgi:hypothetical protein